MIKFTDVSFGFPQKDLYNEICFEIVAGDHAALIGSNGTGKSTLIDMIIHTDEYLYDGKIEKDEAVRIGYIPQFVKHETEDICAFDFLAKPFVELQQKSEAICAEMENAEDMDEVYGRYQKVLDEMDAIDAYNYDSNIRKELAIAGMTALEDTSVKKISGGEFKLLAIIKSMLLKPQLLIMDEPTAGLDPRTHLEFRQMVWELHEQGKTILLSSHNLAELSELCTDIGIIDAGKMVLSGSMDEIMERIYTSKQIIISVHDQMEKALAFLKESPMVRTISICEKDIMVGFTGDEHRESELLKQMIEAGIPVRGFMREPGSLESIFMQITDHNEEKVVLSYEDESGL